MLHRAVIYITELVCAFSPAMLIGTSPEKLEIQHSVTICGQCVLVHARLRDRAMQFHLCYRDVLREALATMLTPQICYTGAIRSAKLLPSTSTEWPSV